MILWKFPSGPRMGSSNPIDRIYADIALISEQTDPPLTSSRDVFPAKLCLSWYAKALKILTFLCFSIPLRRMSKLACVAISVHFLLLLNDFACVPSVMPLIELRNPRLIESRRKFPPEVLLF